MKITFQCLGLALCLTSLLVGCTNSPEQVHTQLEAARELKNADQYREAVPILTALIEAEDSLATALTMRATCYDFLDRTDSANADRQQILAMEDATCYQKKMAANDISNDFMLAQAWDSCLRYHNICLGYEKQCQTPEDVAFTFSAMAYFYRRKQEYQLALSLLDSAKYYGATTYDVAGSRVWVYRDMNELDSALKYATLAVERQSEFKGVYLDKGSDYWMRADIYQRRGELPLACLDWKQALELGTEEAQAKLDSFCVGQ